MSVNTSSRLVATILKFSFSTVTLEQNSRLTVAVMYKRAQGRRLTWNHEGKVSGNFSGRLITTTINSAVFLTDSHSY